MSLTFSSIPLVDLSFQHQPIQSSMEHAIQAVMQRGDYVLGQALTEFETAFAQACSVGHGIGVACGTDAIALGLQACGIGHGDEVILPANTFVATLIGVLRCGATPVLADCDPQTGLLDLMAAEKVITARTRAIIPVHLYGQMVSPLQLLSLASTYDLVIFEDAAQAHLAERDGYRAGAVGMAAAFSFYPSKNLGAMGDGGMVVTPESIVAQTMRSLRNYGAPRKYYHTDYGTNSRLDTLQAAVLNVKLPHLHRWNQARYQAAQLYDALLEPLRPYGIVPMANHSDVGHVYHLYVVRITPDCLLNRELISTELADQGIQTGIHYPIPCHLQPAFHTLGYHMGDFPQAERLSEEILSLPMYPGLHQDQIHQVVTALSRLVTSPQASTAAHSRSLIPG